MHDHRVIVVDALETMLLMLLWISMIGGFAWNDGAGLIFDYPSSSAGAVAACTVWSALLTAPYILHRTRPELAVRLFVGVVAVQLVCGPSLIVADFMAVPMLCAAIVYGERGHLRRYLATAAVFDVLTSLVNASVQVFGPLLPQPRDGRFGVIMYPCPIGEAASGHCGAQFAQAFAIVLFTVSLPLAMAVVVAFWQRARHQTVRLLNERNEAIVAREREERQIAASAERARIARDMHDIVAHTLSIIIIQSDGGRYAARDDPKLARETMETIRRESEHALHDMRRLLGVFGGSEHARLADVDALIEQARAVAPDMTLTTRTLGDPAPARLDGRASVAMYHVVQEALTNIRKYAGARTHVTVTFDWSPETLSIDVDDDGRGAASSLDGHKPGYGLLGMRERVESVGGTVESGPRLSGGFNVHAVVPLGNVDAADAEAATADGAAALADIPSASGVPSDVDACTSTVTAADAAAHPTVPSPGADGADGTADTDDDARREGDEGIVWPFFVKLGHTLRSRPFDQAEDDSPRSAIARLSRWTQRHYVMMDVVMFTLLGCFTCVTGPVMNLATTPGGRRSYIFGVIVTWAVVAPLMLRRRFPRAVALVVAAVCLLQLLVLPGFYTADLYVVFAIHAVALYGRAGSRKWIVPLFTFGCTAFAARCAMNIAGFPSLFAWLSHTPDPSIEALYLGSPHSALVQYGVFSMFLCILAYALGAWTRLGGTNPQVLQARTEALEAERDKQRVMAANHERDRISANIRAEVSDTLNAVIEQTTTELSTIDGQLARGETPSPDFINDAFAQIGAQGRTALAHMRELLSVLRETGFSDEGEHDRSPSLAPAKSLNEQIEHAGEHSPDAR